MSIASWISAALFAALALVLSLYGLTVSGHFPIERRSPHFTSPSGATILFGSIAVASVCLAAGIGAAANRIPWSALVIGAGVPALIAPLLLAPLPDRAVNSRTALLVLSAVAIALVSALVAS